MSDSSAAFDAYYEWLGIHPKDQPPDHYRLLGIERFEANESVIASAADRQMRHVRSFQSGPRSRESQQLLNRISAARICLLRPETKRRYDQQLRQASQAASRSGLRRATPLDDRPLVARPLEDDASPAAVKPVPRAPAAREAIAPSVRASIADRRAKERTVATPVWQRPVVWGPAVGVAVVLLVGAIVWALSGGQPEHLAQNPTASDGSASTDRSSSDDAKTPATTSAGGATTSPFVVEPAPRPADAEAGDSADTSSPAEVADHEQPWQFEIVPGPGTDADNPSVPETTPAPGPNDSLDDLLTPLRMFAESPGAGATDTGTAPRAALGVDELARFSGATGPLRALSVSRDGKYIAAGGDDKICYILDARTLEAVRRYGPHAQPITGVDWKKDGTVGVSTTRDPAARRSIIFWDWATKQESGRAGNTDRNSYGLKISPDDRWCAVSTGLSAAPLYYLSTRVCVLLKAQDELPIHCVAFSPDSTWLVMGKTGQLLRARFHPTGEMDEWEPARVFRDPVSVNDISFLPDGAVFLAALGNGSIVARRLIDCEISGNIPAAHEGSVTSVAVSPDGKRAASGGEDRFVRVWELDKARRILNFSGHTGAITDVAFVDDDVIASTSEDGTLRLWTRGAGKGPSAPAAAVATKRRGEFRKLANHAVPDAAQLATAVKVVQEVFAAEYAQAKDAAGRAALAKKLFEEADKATGAPVDRYALLAEARRLAIAAGAVDAALEATWAIAASFDVDAFAEQADAIDQLAATARSVKDSAELAGAACFAARDAADAGRFDLAQQTAARAVSAAARARDVNLRRLSRETQSDVVTTAAQWEALRKAAAVLKDSPGDQAAKLTVGKFLIVARGQWNRGLTYLIEGSDPALRQLALADLAQPFTAEERVKLANRWMSLAAARTGSERQAYLAAADYWYRRAADDLVGLPKIKIEQALAEIGDLGARKRHD